MHDSAEVPLARMIESLHHGMLRSVLRVFRSVQKFRDSHGVGGVSKMFTIVHNGGGGFSVCSREHDAGQKCHTSCDKMT